MFRAFGSVPGPLVFGSIFDSACVYFRHECGVQGNCWVYDNHLLSVQAIALGAAGLSANFAFSLLAWIVYPKQPPKSNETVRFVELMDQDQDLLVEDANGLGNDPLELNEPTSEVEGTFDTEHTKL